MYFIPTSVTTTLPCTPMTCQSPRQQFYEFRDLTGTSLKSRVVPCAFPPLRRVTARSHPVAIQLLSTYPTGITVFLTSSPDAEPTRIRVRRPPIRGAGHKSQISSCALCLSPLTQVTIRLHPVATQPLPIRPAGITIPLAASRNKEPTRKRICRLPSNGTGHKSQISSCALCLFPGVNSSESPYSYSVAMSFHPAATTLLNTPS